MKIRNLVGFLLVGSAATLSIGCQNPPKENQEQEQSMRIDQEAFASIIDGKEIELYTLSNDLGTKVYLTNYGARVVGLEVSDKEGNPVDVVLGFNKADDYNNPKEPYYGAIVGPYGNRIANASFALDDTTYELVANDGENTLHGGDKGLHFIGWDAEQKDNRVTFTYLHADGQEGFPGNVEMKVTYTLEDDNSLVIDYEAETDKNTVLNLTNHAYFNLNGEGSGSIENHVLQIFAEQYTPVNSNLIPTGELEELAGTPLDFSSPKTIGQDIKQDHPQLEYGKGYDHNFVLSGKKVGELNHAARLIGDQSGIVMDVYTKEPGVQFYSGNFMNEHTVLKSGAKDSFRTALCLETQHYPDSPNHAEFPSTELKVGDKYRTTTVYAFSTEQ